MASTVRLAALMSLAGAVIGACGSDDNGSTDGSAQTIAEACQRTCEMGAQLDCPQDPGIATCTSECQSLTFPDGCDDDVLAYLNCHIAQPSSNWGCNAEQKASVAVGVCTSEEDALATCAPENMGGGGGAGGTGGVGGSGGSGTVGDGCNAIGAALCERLVECGTAVADCQTGFNASCCGDDGTCNDTANVSQAALDVCLAAMTNLACDAAINQDVPAECGGTSEPACAYTNDGECDEPDICPPGTDTADCS